MTTTTDGVVLFVFAGRRANLELQLPLIRRVLAANPRVRYEVWNLARDDSDADWLQTVADDRITVRNTYHGHTPQWEAFSKVWRHYAQPQYTDTLFVKIDDDVVFFEADRFAEFLAVIDANPDRLVSANVINNGACTRLHRRLRKSFQRLGIPLLDVHLSNAYAEAAHQYAADHLERLIDRAGRLEPTDDWLSINMVGCGHAMLSRIADPLGQPSPPEIAGRRPKPGSRLGDEGSANLVPRGIYTGMLAAHLTFGPQHATSEQQQRWRRTYRRISDTYLKRDLDQLDTRLGPRLGDDYRDTLRHALTLAPTGHAVEFGVGEGHTLRMIAEHMPATGFDSFDGLPEDWRPGYPRGHFACEPPQIPNTDLVIGLYDTTLPRWQPPAPISLVHIDCDLYSSTKTVLHHLKPHLRRGVIVVFDEYHGYPGWPHHEALAWAEFVDRTHITYDVIGHGPEQWAIRIT